MKTFVQESLRWAAIAAFGGFGLWMLFSAGLPFFTHWNGDWFSELFMFFVVLVITLPPLAVAYFCFRRQYRKIFLVVGVVGCCFVFITLTSLPQWSGLDSQIDRHIPENPLIGFLGLPLSILFLFGPIYAAAWFFRLCRYLAYCGTEQCIPARKTRATSWLVGLGLCLLLGSMLVPLYHFNMEVQATTSSPSLKSVNNWIFWCSGLTMLGAAMMIAGLAWRRPVVEPPKEPLSTIDESKAFSEREETEGTEFGINY